MTATVRERKHPALRNENDATKHLLKVRMFNLLNTLQFFLQTPTNHCHCMMMLLKSVGFSTVIENS